jgi:hypothetical protein
MGNSPQIRLGGGYLTYGVVQIQQAEINGNYYSVTKGIYLQFVGEMWIGVVMVRPAPGICVSRPSR